MYLVELFILYKGNIVIILCVVLLFRRYAQLICSVITLQSGAGGNAPPSTSAATNTAASNSTTGSNSNSSVNANTPATATNTAAHAGSNANAAAVNAAVADGFAGGGDSMMAQDVQIMRTEMISKCSKSLLVL